MIPYWYQWWWAAQQMQKHLSPATPYRLGHVLMEHPTENME
jgi:hypothetical protein